MIRPARSIPWRALTLTAVVAGLTLATASLSQSPHGLDLAGIDRSVAPGNDFFHYANGAWLKATEIPPDRSSYGPGEQLTELTAERTAELVRNAAAAAAAGSEARKIGDYYASFMDEDGIEKKGLEPLQPALRSIDAVKDRTGLARALGATLRADVDVLNATNLHTDNLLGLWVAQDLDDPERYLPFLLQGGLGMPDRDYYLKDDAKLKDARAKYLTHVAKMLGMAGDAEAETHAAAILNLETELARLQWTRVDNRDPVKTYNKTAIADLPKLMPGYDWRRYVRGTDIDGKVDSVIVSQPSYFSGLDKLMAATPLPVWKAYFKWHVLAAAAPYLSKSFVDERFAFRGTVLSGIPQNRARWKRGIALLDEAMGEALGKLYVAKYFPPENKARMEALVRHLLDAYRRDIDTLDWMSPGTKKGAQEKLSKLVMKIGYPNTWRDYAALQISRDDLWGNVMRANEFEYRRNLDKLGKPVDRNEWQMTPQTVNAYYNPPMNEIVFPAAILQPPFFDARADDAVNYGGIGGVIGHEISHGFDDNGSQYDADGNLRDWFTPEDHEKFKSKTRALVAQYEAYEPVPGFHINGELTLGENIADNSGLAITYKAYHLSLAGRAAPVIEGLTGDERLYLGWAQVWRGKVREADAIQHIKADPHSPPAVRGTAPVVNQEGFYAAFGVKEGDKMYLPPGRRVTIW